MCAAGVVGTSRRRPLAGWQTASTRCVAEKLQRKHVDAGGISGLSELLHGWLDAQGDYMAAMNFEDRPWSYNELAVTGFLAAAAWRLNGGVALQEYRTRKGHLEKDRWLGRCDLYTLVGDNAFALRRSITEPILLAHRTNRSLISGKTSGTLLRT